jgi:sugar/nucleoside kinase (ribokinase family)
MKKMNDKKMIVGIGSALIDILVYEDDDFVQTLNAEKGGMTLVDMDFIQQALSKVSSEPNIVPGGSACNTIIGIGQLGGMARFVGKRGKDEFGGIFETDLKRNHVDPNLLTSPSSTGRVLSIITPDAQRSMFTFLGASSEMLPEDIAEKCFEDATIVYVEGYLLFNKDLILKALQTAKKSGALIALDLASFTVVEESKDILAKIISDYVDILIANEDETRAFTGYSDERKGLEALSKDVDIAVLKVGKRGSYIAHKGEITRIKPKGSGEAIDTTGAGDLWASGFLFGLMNGYPLEKCGELGSACGYEVCQVVGANIPEDGWERIKNIL